MTFQIVKKAISITLLCTISIISLFIFFYHVSEFIRDIKQIIDTEQLKTKMKEEIPNKNVIIPNNHNQLYSLSEIFELLFSKEVLQTEQKNDMNFLEDILVSKSSQKNPLNLFTYPTKNV